MVVRRRLGSLGPCGVALALLVALGLGGCARLPLAGSPGLPRPAWLGGAPERAVHWDFFATPRPGDPFSLPIASWRVRERAALRAGGVAPVPDLPPVSAAPAVHGSPSGDYALSERYEVFVEQQRRALAPEVLRWVQAVARERYVEDGPIDHWPTLTELLHSAGDDCDGLELLAYHALRQLGFPPDRIYRAILENPETEAHHMVTFWFEDPDDPWVLDPTDTVSSRVRRMSTISDWVPLKVFSEDAEFSVTRLAENGARPAPDPDPSPDPTGSE